eukprot:5386592-Pyramimonas_sp.AAC.1
MLTSPGDRSHQMRIPPGGRIQLMLMPWVRRADQMLIPWGRSDQMLAPLGVVATRCLCPGCAMQIRCLSLEGSSLFEASVVQAWCPS